MGSAPWLQSPEDGRKLCAKRRKIPFKYAPQHLKVNAEIVVDKDVAQACHIPPGDIGIARPDFLGDVLRRLAKHRETADVASWRILSPMKASRPTEE